jgi:hypothetical protein
MECPFSVKVWEHMAMHFGLVSLPVRWILKDLSIQEQYMDMASRQSKAQIKNIFPASNLVCFELRMNRTYILLRKRSCLCVH